MDIKWLYNFRGEIQLQNRLALRVYPLFIKSGIILRFPELRTSQNACKCWIPNSKGT